LLPSAIWRFFKSGGAIAETYRYRNEIKEGKESASDRVGKLNDKLSESNEQRNRKNMELEHEIKKNILEKDEIGKLKDRALENDTSQKQLPGKKKMVYPIPSTQSSFSPIFPMKIQTDPNVSPKNHHG
jgi:hypothetical protein